MVRAGKIALWAVLLCGCAGRQPYAVLHAPAAAPAVGTPVNLALGPTAEHNRFAEFFTQRSTWPSAPMGYRFDDASYHVEVIYDDQAFYDRLGGGYFRTSETVRTSTLLR